VPLVFTLIGLFFALTVMFWGLSLFLQGYLYSEPADKLPLRAIVAGLFVALFMTGWTYANTRASHKDKYGTLFEFAPGEVRPISEFEGVRRYNIKELDGKWREEMVKFTRPPGGNTFYETNAPEKQFELSKSTYVYIALIVPDGDAKVRLETPVSEKFVYEDPERFYREPDGKRYLEGTDPQRMVIPSAGAYATALALNAGLFLVWLAAFWLVVRFSIGHSLGLTAVFGGIVLFVVMPLLFNSNAVGKS